MSDEMAALIAKLEAAARPGKELDRQIARLVGWHRVEPRHSRSKIALCIAALKARASIRASGTQTTPTTKTEGRT